MIITTLLIRALVRVLSFRCFYVPDKSWRFHGDTVQLWELHARIRRLVSPLRHGGVFRRAMRAENVQEEKRGFFTWQYIYICPRKREKFNAVIIYYERNSINLMTICCEQVCKIYVRSTRERDSWFIIIKIIIILFYYDCIIILIDIPLIYITIDWWLLWLFITKIAKGSRTVGSDVESR